MKSKGLKGLILGVAVSLCVGVAGAATGSAQEPRAMTDTTASTEAAAAAEPFADSTIITSTATGGQSVAFTFDDGPNPPNTTNLLAVLAKYDVQAVFCLIGQNVQQNPWVVQQIVEAGHVLCNHSMGYDDMGSWSQDQIRNSIQQTTAAIQAAAPGAEIPYFRAPNGSWGQTPQVAASMGLQPLGWRLDIGDWNPSDANTLANRLRQGVTPGAVVVMHDGGGDRAATTQAVDMVIPEFQAQGWTFDLPAPPR